MLISQTRNPRRGMLRILQFDMYVNFPFIFKIDTEKIWVFWFFFFGFFKGGGGFH